MINEIHQAEKKSFSKDTGCEREALRVRIRTHSWPGFCRTANVQVIGRKSHNFAAVYTFAAPSKLRAHNFPLVISIHRE